LPITSLFSQDLQSRGSTTIADAVSSLSNNNAGNLPTSFSANDAFDSGASGASSASSASLRGLTMSSTLVLFDGLRAAYFPLADDDTRNFVDLNTIPYALVDRVEMLARYAIISPKQERLGGTAHFTARLGDKSEAYAAFTYYQSRVGYSSAPSNVLNYTPPGATGQIFDTRAGTDTPLTLPVYICARGTTVACTAANGQLNPNNPFAALGQGAQIRYQLADIPTYNMTLSRTFRGAAGMTANFSGFDFRAEATAMRTNLTATQTGQIFVQHLLDVIADGSYNFVDPSLNTQTTRDYLTPVSVTKSHSELYQAQASLQHNLFELPGGSALLAVGAAIRYEAINNPSANPDSNGSTQRYFNINAVGAIGHRTVYSAYFESDFPVLRSLDLNVSGRYDKYSSGQKNFSPKVSAKFSPARFLTVRGSYSRGFRIPSFSESNGLPTTGFITVNAPDAFNAAHGNNGYGQNYGLGLTNVGTPGLKPEKSRNITAGVVFQPARWLDLTVDYYNIRKTNVITGADYSVALNAIMRVSRSRRAFSSRPMRLIRSSRI
jgi:iron complex outermembrane receptor protein